MTALPVLEPIAPRRMLLRGRVHTCRLLAVLAAFFQLSAHAEPLLPTADGTTWTYKREGGEPATVTVRIAGREKVGAKELLRGETAIDDELETIELLSIGEHGVQRHRVSRGE